MTEADLVLSFVSLFALCLLVFNLNRIGRLVMSGQPERPALHTLS